MVGTDRACRLRVPRPGLRPSESVVGTLFTHASGPTATNDSRPHSPRNSVAASFPPPPPPPLRANVRLPLRIATRWRQTALVRHIRRPLSLTHFRESFCVLFQKATRDEGTGRTAVSHRDHINTHFSARFVTGVAILRVRFPCLRSYVLTTRLHCRSVRRPFRNLG